MATRSASEQGCRLLESYLCVRNTKRCNVEDGFHVYAAKPASKDSQHKPLKLCSIHLTVSSSLEARTLLACPRYIKNTGCRLKSTSQVDLGYAMRQPAVRKSTSPQAQHADGSRTEKAFTFKLPERPAPRTGDSGSPILSKHIGDTRPRALSGPCVLQPSSPGCRARIVWRVLPDKCACL